VSASFKKTLQYIVLLLIGSLLIYLSIQKADVSLSELQNVFQNTNLIWVFVSIVISFLSHFARAYRWNYLLENYNYKTDLLTSNASVFIGYLANYGLPRMGEISRCAVVSKYNNIPLDIALGTVLAERVVDVLLMFVLFILVVIFQYNDLQELLNKYILQPFSEKLSGTNLILILALLIIGGILLYILNQRKTNKNSTSLWDKIFQVIQNLTKPLLSIHKIKHPIQFWGLSIGIWLMYFLSMYFCAWALPSTEGISFLKIMVLFLFGTIGVILTPGGIGAYHFLITELLLFYNVDKASAVAFPWLVWGTQFLMVLILGGLSFILLPIIHEK